MVKRYLLVLVLVGLAACSGPETNAVDCTQLDNYRVPASQLMADFQAYVSRLDLEDPASRSVAEKSVRELLDKARDLPCAEQHPEKQADLEGAILTLQEAVDYAKRGDRIDVYRSMEKVKAHIHSFTDWSGTID